MARQEIQPPKCLDTIFDILRHPHRRHILTILYEGKSGENNKYTLEDFTNKCPSSEPYTQQLYHQHLPKLANAGYIKWNRDRNIIRVGKEYSEIQPYIRFLAGNQE